MTSPLYHHALYDHHCFNCLNLNQTNFILVLAIQINCVCTSRSKVTQAFLLISCTNDCNTCIFAVYCVIRHCLLFTFFITIINYINILCCTCFCPIDLYLLDFHESNSLEIKSNPYLVCMRLIMTLRLIITLRLTTSGDQWLVIFIGTRYDPGFCNSRSSHKNFETQF